MAAVTLPLPLAAELHGFEVSLLVFGGLLVLGALVSGLERRSFVSLTSLFVLVGFVLGPGVTGAVRIDARSPFVSQLAAVALVVILFRDGLEVDAEMLQKQWRLPLRKLVLATPITAVIIAVTTHVCVGLTWTESFLLGVLLSPTDPVLSSGVVTNPRVPMIVRHSLNLESGTNDGLALPAVLALAAALGGGSHFVWWRFFLQDVSIGLATGVLIGFLAAWVMPKGDALDEIPIHYRSLYGLGCAFVCYGVTVLPPHGNGLIAVFVCAITLGIRRPDLAHHFQEQAADLVELVKLGIFVVFGSLLTLHGLFDDGWGAVAVVVVTLFVARTVGVFVALWGTKPDRATKAFMAWFGPKGVATMTFSILVLSDSITAGTRIFNLAALTVFCSILLHGATDTAGSNWIADRAERRRKQRAEDRPPDRAGSAA